MNKFDIRTLTETLNNINGAIALAQQRADVEVTNLVKASKNKCFTFTRHENEDENFNGEKVFGEVNETIRVINAHFKGSVLYLDGEDGNEWQPYELGISMPDLLNAMITELKERGNKL